MTCFKNPDEVFLKYVYSALSIQLYGTQAHEKLDCKPATKPVIAGLTRNLRLLLCPLVGTMLCFMSHKTP